MIFNRIWMSLFIGSLCFLALMAFAKMVLADQVKWTVRPYGHDVWAVSKTYGDGAEWSRAPTDIALTIEEVIACKDIPSEKMANMIANALNH